MGRNAVHVEVRAQNLEGLAIYRKQIWKGAWGRIGMNVRGVV